MHQPFLKTPPSFLHAIGENVVLTNTSIGPGVSIGEGTKIVNSSVKESIIQKHSVIENAQLNNAMIGNHVRYNGKFTSVSIGDYSELQ